MARSQDSTLRWLSLRARLLCGSVLIIGSLFPPYVPNAALAVQEVAVSQQQFVLVEDGFLMKSSSLSKQGARRAYAEGSYHTVSEGDSVERLANRYGIQKQTIVWANDLDESVAIQPGDELLILPVDGVIHSVKRGQTLARIAQLYGVEMGDVAEQNSLEGGFILAGQELIIPGGAPLPKQQPVVVAARPPAPPPPSSEPDSTEPAPPAPAPAPVFVPEPSGGVLQRPCSAECFVTQYYHAGHYALDMQERGGGPIYASDGGTVTRADYGWNGGYGNVIEIDHGNGLVTLYAHNKTLNVEEGHVVSRGQKIADMGNTGLVYGATGIHVHFEVRLRGIKKNPLLYIE